MILVPSKKLILPSRFKQRGSIQMGAAGALAAGGAGGGTIWDLSDLINYSDVGVVTQTYAVEVVFQIDGTVDVLRDIGSDLLNQQDPYVDPTSETINTWVRCTHNFGDDMTAGEARGVWLRCDSQRIFTMRQTSGSGPPELNGNFDFELSSDSSGSPVEASALGKTIMAGEII